MWYWSFGSNLNPRVMQRRCPGAAKVGPLVVEEGRLVFRDCADVVSDMEAKIAGGVWKINRQHERELDRYEGVSSGFYKKKYLRLKIKGVSGDCLYYQMGTKTGIQPPSEDYYNTILEGYRFFGLDETLLNQALHDSWDEKKMTEWLHSRRHRKGYPRLQRLSNVA